MAICEYVSKYFDYTLKKNVNYKCKETVVQDRLCIFHHSSFYKSHGVELSDKFNKIIQNPPEDIVFVGGVLPEITKRSYFEFNVYFVNITFLGSVDFSGSEFKGLLIFFKCKINGGFFFSSCTFRGMTNFFRCEILHHAVFDHAIFQSNISFNSTRFLKGVNFSKAEFKAYANFFETKFYYVVLFNGATFFEKMADFHQTKFLPLDPSTENGITIDPIKMRESLVIFSGGVSFLDVINSESEVNEKDDYPLTYTLSPNVDFSEVTFYCRARFESSEFKIQTQFASTFNESATFRNVEFSAYCSFNYSSFTKNVDFRDSLFNSPTKFNYVTFEQPEKILFEVHDLSQVSFLNTDISKVLFGDVNWGKIDKFKVFDEFQFENSLKNNKDSESSLNDLLSVYRSLRENYEYRLRYDEAGQFFIKEMELKRNYAEKNNKIREKSWIEKHLSPIGLYHILGDYGENYKKPLAWLALFMAVSFIIWTIISPSSYEVIQYQIQTNQTLSKLVTPFYNFSIINPTTNSTLTSTLSNAPDDGISSIINAMKLSLDRTLANLFQINEKSIWLDYFLRGLFIISLGIFFVAIKRKLERRFRH